MNTKDLSEAPDSVGHSGASDGYRDMSPQDRIRLLMGRVSFVVAIVVLVLAVWLLCTRDDRQHQLRIRLILSEPVEANDKR